MELRKLEQELDELSKEWKDFRRKRPRFDTKNGNDSGDDVSNGGGGGFEALSTQMPSWKELRSKVKDEDIFPQEEEEEQDAMEIELATITDKSNVNGTDAPNNNESIIKDADEPAGYSEFGMCIAPSENVEKEPESAKSNKSTKAKVASIFERYAAKTDGAPKSKDQPVKKAEEGTSQQTTSKEEEEDVLSIEDASAKDVLSGLESLQQRFVALEPKIDKFMAKLKDRDPITKKPRYGEKTLSRVKEVVRIYNALEHGVAIVFKDTESSPCIVSSLRSQIHQHDEQLNVKLQAQQSKEQLEEERIAKEKSEAVERANQQRLLEEQLKREEEMELARQAEEARKRRVEEEQRALDEERAVDQELLALVPTLGVDGVHEQIGHMREALKGDRAALDVALGSLYTLFEQIVRKPEETNFRRVRRDHPKFMEDIGRHVGGREVLIAAGFQLVKLDGVPSFLSKEPHIETDMDGWSNWFDLLKKTLDVIEEEMIK